MRVALEIFEVAFILTISFMAQIHDVTTDGGGSSCVHKRFDVNPSQFYQQSRPRPSCCWSQCVDGVDLSVQTMAASLVTEQRKGIMMCGGTAAGTVPSAYC